MTADVIQANNEECMKCGMDDYVSKPFEEEQLYSAVARFFESGWLGGKVTLWQNSFIDDPVKSSIRLIFGVMAKEVQAPNYWHDIIYCYEASWQTLPIGIRFAFP